MELRERWVQALRSGDYPQDRHRLRTLKGFCCLGVLCDLVAQDRGWKWATFQHEDDVMMVLKTGTGSEGTYPPYGLLEDMGIEYCQRSILANINDKDGLTFAEIADKIESFK